jgi:arginyl-tRNA synthetase
MIKQQLLESLNSVLKQKATALNLPVGNGCLLAIERPKQGSFGDYAVNVSSLAKYAKMAPPQIAGMLAEDFAQAGWEPSLAGGFINFQVSEARLIQSLLHLIQVDKPGQNETMKETHCLLEFVSANPTGPLHIGHGRWVALGDSIGRLFRHCGATVTNEFYVNDAGNQIFNLANSIWYRCLEILETGGKLPEAVPDQPYPFYPGEYVIDLAQDFLVDHRQAVLAWDTPEHQAPEEAIQSITAFSKERIMAHQKALMAQCHLTFDEWFSEKTLHTQGSVEDIIKTLQANGVTYEKEGALWFASSRFGDDQDRVLIKSDGNYTYLTADIAYHDQKFQRDNSFYNLFINIWGADHHGYIARMKAALEALGHDPAKLEILLGQLVNLIIDGERTRMGKRKKMLTLEELVEEVGVDAVRFWMVSKSQDTPLDFNVQLAASASDENPVFYVQYAHARCAGILRNTFQPRLDTISKTELPPILNQEQWQAFMGNLSPDSFASLFTQLENDPAKASLKELILKLDSFEDKILDAARQRLPHLIARYTQEVAADFHRFYNVCRILVPDAEVAQVRLVVILAIKRVLAQALELLGVSAPDQM